MIRRRVVVAGGVLALVAAAAVAGIVTLQSSESDRTTKSQDQSSELPPRAEDAAIWFADNGDLMVELPQRAYIARWDSDTSEYAEPERFAHDSFTATAKASRGQFGTRMRSLSFYGVNADGRVTDVIAVSRRRGGNRELDSFQYRVSRRGVELIWSPMDDGACSVKRDGDKVAEARAYYRDPKPPTEQTEYRIECDQRVTVEYEGETYHDTDSDAYTVYMPAWDDSAIGKPIEDVEPGINGGLKRHRRPKGLRGADASSSAQEYARFLEWNAFISDEFVSAPPCDGDRKFGGDDRGWSDVPARDAFDELGRPLSKISTRVGSSFDQSDAGRDLNDQFYDDWLFKAVGTSRAYNDDGELIDVENAGTTGIKLVKSLSSDDAAYRKVDARVGNVLCSILGYFDAPDISFNYEYIASDEGEVSVNAEFDKAPDTELLWEASDDMDDPSTLVGGCLYRFENEGFHKLLPPFPNQTETLAFPDPSEPPAACEVH